MVRGPSKARARLLEVASGLFYREGIHSVGVDRIIDEASVARATFYTHFASKEALVAEYLRGEDARLRALVEAAAGVPSERILDAIITGIDDDVRRHHSRGCPFINAAAEYPDAASEVRQIIAEHRAWFRAALEQALTAAGVANPSDAADALVLLRDAALVGGYLDGIDASMAAFARTARLAVGA